MGNLMFAVMRSFASLAKPGVWGAILLPAAIACLLWLVAVFWGLGILVDWLIQNPPMTILAAWGLGWLAIVLAYLGGWMAVFALTYLVASMIAAIFVMPMLLQKIASSDYPELSLQGADSFVSATGNSITSLIYFVLAWLLTLPLWLIPGLGFIIPLLLLGWYNTRTFAYDALSLHARPSEWERLQTEHKRDFLTLGVFMALLAHVPIVGLFVPTFAALSFIHLGLTHLRNLRGISPQGGFGGRGDGRTGQVIEGEVVR